MMLTMLGAKPLAAAATSTLIPGWVRPVGSTEPPLPTLISGDLALTSTPPRDGAGARAQVVRRQPDGSWLRVLDQPEFIPV